MSTTADALPPAPRRGRPAGVSGTRASRTLSRDGIIDAALRVLDAEGLEGMSMRRVAAELGTGPASLYAHVADKDEMVAAVLDRVIGEVELPDPIDATRWQEQLKELARAARATFVRHGDIARATLGTIPLGENALRASDRILGIMLAGGVNERVAALSVDILSLYFSTVAYEESIEESAFKKSPKQAEYYHVQVRQFFAGLPVERFPHLVAMAVPLTSGDGNERFEFGLDMLVRGIASTVV